MDEKNLKHREWPACPVETTLSLIGDKWKVLILRELLGGTKRFAMEADGLVHREVFAEVPPRVEYSLTPLGESLAPVIDALKTWGEGFKAQLAS